MRVKGSYLQKVLDSVKYSRRWAGISGSIILGLIFIISGAGKLLHQSDFLDTLLTHSILFPELALWVTYLLPWVECVIGVLLVIGISARLLASLSAVLIAAFITNNGWLIAKGLAYKPCGCFGIFEKLFLDELSSLESLYLDIVMLALVVLIISCYPSRFLTVRPWFFGGSKRPSAS